MGRLIRLFSTSIGRKLLMAVTGVLLLGFLVAHMLGNMSVFQGADSLNAYAAWLQGHPFLWLMRGALAAVFFIHVWVAVVLSLENRAARTAGYAHGQRFQVSTTSRYMLVTGVFVIVFVIGHLLHFTFGSVGSEFYGGVDALGRHDVYSMVVRSFQNPWFSGCYVLAIVMVGFHLSHAIKSLFQTFGIHHDSYNTAIRVFGRVLVGVFVLGNCSIPILILAGVIGLGEG